MNKIYRVDYTFVKIVYLGEGDSMEKFIEDKEINFGCELTLTDAFIMAEHLLSNGLNNGYVPTKVTIRNNVNDGFIVIDNIKGIVT